MNAATIWTLLSIFVIAPLGALAFDRPCFGNWIWHMFFICCAGHGNRSVLSEDFPDGYGVLG